jgi:sugar phosphate isomerase/epimerase
LTTFFEYTSKFGDLLKNSRGDIEVYSIHTLNQQFEPELYNTAERTKNDCEFFLRQAAEVGAKLKAKYYTFQGPANLKGRKVDAVNYEFWGGRTDEIDSILQKAGSGLRLAYENVHWTYFATPEFFRRLKPYTGVAVCLDIKQAMQARHSVDEYIEVMGNRLKNVHICDYDQNGKLMLPRRGIVDFKGLFKRLRQVGYDGPCMIEVYSGDYDSLSEISDSIKYLQDL